MRIERREAIAERLAVTAMVVSDDVLNRVTAKWRKDSFRSKWANTVAQWCVDYCRRHGKAPGRDVESLFASWASKADPAHVELVEAFIRSISGEYSRRRKELNVGHAIDSMGRLFREVALERLADEIRGDLAAGEIEKAEQRRAKFDSVDLSGDDDTCVLQDITLVKSALNEERESIVQYPGPLGEFFGDSLERDGFVVIEAPEKRGKTMWLLDIAWTAMCQRKRTLLIEAGDMSRPQVLRRLAVKAAKVPLRPTKPNRPIRWPTSAEIEDKKLVVSHEELTFESGITSRAAEKAFRKTARNIVKSDDPYLRMSVRPAGTMTVDGIASVVRQREKEGWPVDVLVIDYADILAPAPGYRESRDSINANWQALRALSQEFHCLVVTATQANAASYKVETMDMANFSEDKRKHAHVTGMIGINQTDEEKVNGVQRLNWIVRREDEFVSKRPVYVAGCMALCRPHVLSAW